MRAVSREPAATRCTARYRFPAAGPQLLLAAIFATMLLSLASPAGARKRPPAKPIDLNRATKSQLEELPGIGPAMAQRILEFREKSGPFEHVTDLRAIRGIGRKRFDAIRHYVFVGRPYPKNARRR